MTSDIPGDKGSPDDFDEPGLREASKKASSIVNLSSAVVQYRRLAVGVLIAVMAVIAFGFLRVIETYDLAVRTQIEVSARQPVAGAVPAQGASEAAAASAPIRVAASGHAASSASSASTPGNGAAEQHLASLPSTTFVALVAVLVCALSVLAVTLLRTTFAEPEEGRREKSNAVPDGVPMIEFLKAVKDAIDGLIKGKAD
jgi:uncharacterized protein involved in exopolysaccharide biosynthesis